MNSWWILVIRALEYGQLAYCEKTFTVVTYEIRDSVLSPHSWHASRCTYLAPYYQRIRIIYCFFLVCHAQYAFLFVSILQKSRLNSQVHFQKYTSSALLLHIYFSDYSVTVYVKKRALWNIAYHYALSSLLNLWFIQCLEKQIILQGFETCPVNSHAYITDFECTGTDKYLVHESTLSFYSGHSAFSFYAAWYTAVSFRCFQQGKTFFWRHFKLSSIWSQSFNLNWYPWK